MSRYDYDTWFVYELIDPRTKAVFYIGKSATPRARLNAHKTSGESSAYPRICEIRADGHEVQMYVIGRFNTEAEALDYEGYLISKTPNLVNRRDYHNPTEPFRRPVVGSLDLQYTTEENQPVPDDDTIAQAIAAQLPHVSLSHIVEVLKMRAVLFDEDHEYHGVTDE